MVNQFKFIKTLSAEQLQLFGTPFIKNKIFTSDIMNHTSFYVYLQKVIQKFEINENEKVNIDKILHSFISIFLQDKDELHKIQKNIMPSNTYFTINMIDQYYQNKMYYHNNPSFINIDTYSNAAFVINNVRNGRSIYSIDFFINYCSEFQMIDLFSYLLYHSFLILYHSHNAYLSE